MDRYDRLSRWCNSFWIKSNFNHQTKQETTERSQNYLLCHRNLSQNAISVCFLNFFRNLSMSLSSRGKMTFIHTSKKGLRDTTLMVGTSIVLLCMYMPASQVGAHDGTVLRFTQKIKFLAIQLCDWDPYRKMTNRVAASDTQWINSNILESHAALHATPLEMSLNNTSINNNHGTIIYFAFFFIYHIFGRRLGYRNAQLTRGGVELAEFTFEHDIMLSKVKWTANTFREIPDFLSCLSLYKWRKRLMRDIVQRLWLPWALEIQVFFLATRRVISNLYLYAPKQNTWSSTVIFLNPLFSGSRFTSAKFDRKMNAQSDRCIPIARFMRRRPW